MDVTFTLTLTNTDAPYGSAPAVTMDCRLLQGTVTAYEKVLHAPFPSTVTFASPAAGDYTFSAQALDAYSHNVGSAFTETVSVPVPPPVVNQLVTGATFAFA